MTQLPSRRTVWAFVLAAPFVIVLTSVAMRHGIDRWVATAGETPPRRTNYSLNETTPRVRYVNLTAEMIRRRFLEDQGIHLKGSLDLLERPGSSFGIEWPVSQRVLLGQLAREFDVDLEATDESDREGNLIVRVRAKRGRRGRVIDAG